MHGAGTHAWWEGACMAGGQHGWQGEVCMVGGACVAGETATAADGTHHNGMHSCSTSVKLPSVHWQLP